MLLKKRLQLRFPHLCSLPEVTGYHRLPSRLWWRQVIPKHGQTKEAIQDFLPSDVTPAACTRSFPRLLVENFLCKADAFRMLLVIPLCRASLDEPEACHRHSLAGRWRYALDICVTGGGDGGPTPQEQVQVAGTLNSCKKVGSFWQEFCRSSFIALRWLRRCLPAN